ncbi:pre-rRNA processing protein Utp22 [Lojkania enalia]|uniref:U3 small nucleolar RNA-associated protein 22 n=1 Tax=Lojkania enalia TaxID=147567 RepID=A0A9P4KJ09_9PLEO|nr:pre-rRNA processing protein Utp22 [Didymosphaeria enalia]
MASPATKRRKLSYSDESDRSEGGYDNHDSDNLHSQGEDIERRDIEDTDDSMPDVEYTEEGGSYSIVNAENAATASPPNNEVESHTASAHAKADKTPYTRQSMSLRDGVYTSEVYKSNVFKLQVDELLQQVKPKYGKKKVPAENAMRILKSIIEQLPNRTPLSIPEARASLKSEGVVIPFPNPQPSKDAKYKLQYDRPSSINATGSYPLEIATQTEDSLSIDLVVTMPKAIFQEKDYLNYRYFYKRAYYLACIAAGIKTSKRGAFSISFGYLNGNHLQPIIVIRPSLHGDIDDFASSNFQIHILLAIPEKTFAESKLLPISNSIRPKGMEDGAETQSLSPTPFYNGSIQSDATVSAYLKLLHFTSSKSDAYKDACVLGRLWLKQRGFGSSVRKGGFGNFEWAATVALLLEPDPGTAAAVLSPGYSSYQLFKATLQFLATHNLSEYPYRLYAHDIIFPKGDNTPVFFDGPRKMNILFKMMQWSYSRLQAEAQTTIQMLSDSRFDQFESTFILKTDIVKYHYDSTLEMPLSKLQVDTNSDNYFPYLNETIGNIHKILIRALTDRVDIISFALADEDNWPISSNLPRENQRKTLLINFATNPITANRTVDLGPTAENKREAASFRQFWGEKAELRRFKDGSIRESIVWSTKNTSVLVLEQIISFILGKHLSLTFTENARFSSDTFAHLVPFGRIQGQSGIVPFVPLLNNLAGLEQDIRQLEHLPLQIRRISAADALLRYSAIEIPTSVCPNSTPASIVLQFEGSARWPDDLCAIQRTKIAFLLKLSDLLSAAKPSYVTRIGLENPSQPSQNQSYLDIITPQRFSFRLRIHHDREATLLDRQLKDKSLDGQSRESAASALAAYKRDFLQTPAHTQALQALCTRFPALSPSIRLTKRWFSCHLLSPHFSSEFIELLVARTFLQPYPWPVPSCATTGFLRTLAWIARWDWRHVPLVVDFSIGSNMNNTGLEPHSRALSTEDIEKIRMRFEAWRQIDPSMNRVVVFAATNLDNEGTTWTDRAKPEKVVAARMTALARAATDVIRSEEDNMLTRMKGKAIEPRNMGQFVSETLFISRVEDFDIIIHLPRKYSRARKISSEPQFKNLQLQQGTGELQTTLGFGPAQLFVAELRDIYGEAILWFWDSESFNIIVGLWNPQVTTARAWKVKASWNSLPTDIHRAEKKSKRTNLTDQMADMRVNKGAICNEIKRLGGELVERIEIN